MRKFVLAASIALLTACSAPQQEQLNLMLQPQLSMNTITQGKAFTLTSKDARTAQYVALIDSGHSNIEPIHAKQNVRIALENALLEQFESQGFKNTVNSENNIVVEVQKALVSVKHSVMENQMDASLILEVTAETPKGKLVKTYNGSAKRSGMLSASNDDIQNVLNDVMNLVLKEVANDAELQKYMKERF